MGRRRYVPTVVIAFVSAVCLAVTGCSTGSLTSRDPSTPEAAEATGPAVLRIVAGSEQKTVLETIVGPWCKDKGYTCTWKLKGSVDQARDLQAGQVEADAYWFASSVFSQLANTKHVLSDVKPMFLTPVVYAGYKPVMDRLGLVGKDVTAVQIIDSLESGKTKVWATNPTQSNSGDTVLFSFLNHFAGNPPGQALTAAQLKDPKVVDGMKKFFNAMDRTPPSTGTMTSQCVKEPNLCQTMFTYEDLVIEENQKLVREGKDPLYVAYPRGAMAISDAPLGFVDHGQANAEEHHKIFTELQNYLLEDDAALKKLAAIGRRPGNGVGLSMSNADTKVFNPDWGIKTTLKEQGVTFPSSEVIDQALDNYHSLYRKPVNTYYCLDGSGSMDSNGGWDGVKDAARALFDPAEAKRNRLQTAEKDVTTVAIFNRNLAAGPWTVTGNDPSKLTDLREEIDGYDPQGGTNMYSCLDRAVQQLSTSSVSKKLIVVMSDGQSEDDSRDPSIDALRKAHIPVVTIAFGKSASPGQLQEVAKASGGSYVSNENMVSALREAAGYK